MEEVRKLKPVAWNEKPMPTADVRVTADGYEIIVGAGNYELYVDKRYIEAITQDQPRERILPMEAGEHCLDVYSQGRFITPEGGVVGVFGAIKLEPEQPAEEPAPGDKGTVSVGRESLERLANEMRGLSDMIIRWLEEQ